MRGTGRLDRAGDASVIDGDAYAAATGIVIDHRHAAGRPADRGPGRDTPYWTNHEVIEAEDAARLAHRARRWRHRL